MADAEDSKSSEVTLVGVRPPLPAPVLKATAEMVSSQLFHGMYLLLHVASFRRSLLFYFISAL